MQFKFYFSEWLLDKINFWPSEKTQREREAREKQRKIAEKSLCLFKFRDEIELLKACVAVLISRQFENQQEVVTETFKVYLHKKTAWRPDQMELRMKEEEEV